MSKLISANDKLGEFFNKKIGALKDSAMFADASEEYDRACAEVGVKTIHYDGGRREFYEMGFSDACEAVGRGTNLVLTWDALADSLVVIFADGEAQAEQSILQLCRKLLKLKRELSAKKAR